MRTLFMTHPTTVVQSESLPQTGARSAGIRTKTWTAEQVAFLQENHGKLSYSELAKAIGKSRVAVWNMASRMGLCGNWRPRKNPHPVKYIAKPEPVCDTVAKRRCLGCLKDFYSAGIHNRICEPCKQFGPYRSYWF